MQPLKALQPQDAAKAAAILERLTQDVQGMDKIWGATPTLQLGEVEFRRRKDKAAIPVLDIYFVLGEMYSHGKHYQATPAADHPGRYEFKHKTSHYRLTSSNYRTSVNKQLVPLLRNLAETENHHSKIALKKDAVSGIIEMKFRSPDCSPLAFRFIPALAGVSLPEGVNPLLSTLEKQPVWFLVVPQDSASNGMWELNFPMVGEDLLGDASTSPILLASWLTEMHSVGLKNPNKALTSLALELQQSGESTLHPETSVRTQAVKVLQKLITKAKDSKSLTDFCVPSREHLLLSPVQLEAAEAAIRSVTSAEEWTFLAGSFPGTLPEEDLDFSDIADFVEAEPDEERGGESSEISSTTTDSDGVVTGGETESEPPPIHDHRSPTPAPRLNHRRSITRAKTISSSESDNEEPVSRVVNETVTSERRTSYQWTNGVRPSRRASMPDLRRQQSVNGPKGVKFMSAPMLLAVFVAVMLLVIPFLLTDYDWMHELTRLYDTIVDKCENISHGVDVKTVVSPNQNDL